MKIYIGTVRGDMSHLPVLYPHLGNIDKPQRLFFNFAHAFPDKLFELAKTPEEADFLLIPHDYFSAARHPEYVQEYVGLAEKTGKKILIFDHSDFDAEIPVPNSIIFRVSQYRYKMKKNEIIMPPIIEDLGASGIEIRKKGSQPVVGFCGWAGFIGLKDRMKYTSKIAFASISSLVSSYAAIHKPGLYFRRRAIAAVRLSDKLTSNFLIRNTYSGHRETISLDPAEARRQYVQNIIDSDLILAPKGDGNYSNRFYEIMSLGRIPILIDTDCVLPLEDQVDYNSCILRVSYDKIDDLPQIIADRYAAMDDEAFRAMQLKARDTFETCLAADKFFNKVFSQKNLLESIVL